MKAAIDNQKSNRQLEYVCELTWPSLHFNDHIPYFSFPLLRISFPNKKKIFLPMINVHC